MKTTKWILCTTAAVLGACACTKEPSRNPEAVFPDPVFRAYVLEHFDLDGNGRISDEEAAQVTKIDVDGSGKEKEQRIQSLEGIQQFPNLMSLSCADNQLTAIDVSKNTQLQKLVCWDNQLTTLDVSKNTQLQSLSCMYNQLTTLDVSNNTQLQSLACSRNQLTAIDVSNNTQLQYLVCENNRLTTLDVSKNTQLRYLSCEDNQLTTLDVSKTNLGNSTVSFPLTCSLNPIKTLILKNGWKINGINSDRSNQCIPDETEIVYVD